MTHWASLSKAGAPEGAPTVDRVRNARHDLRPTSCMAGMHGGATESSPREGATSESIMAESHSWD